MVDAGGRGGRRGEPAPEDTMAINSLQDLYVNKLQMIYDGEQQGLQAMQQLSQMVSNPDARQGLEMHRRQTEEQVRRLEQIFQRQGQRAQATECASMRALIQETQRMVQQIQDPDTRDAFLISAQQGMEHHEMADYGTARTWARQLGNDEDAQLLQQTLQEEEQADKLLTQIAERNVNQQAAQGDRDVTRAAQRDDAARGAGGRAAGTSTGGASAGGASADRDARA
jgi:ferritin-like metal-binding protein YciE